MHPTGGGTRNGTLTFRTTAGNVTARLHAQTPGVPPSIASFAPASGPTGTTVTITGAQFTGATAAAFGGTAAQSFNIVSDTQITAVVAAGTVTGNVTVTSPGGTATSAHPFVVVAPRSLIYTVSPGQGLPGSTVTILGQNLSGASVVELRWCPGDLVQRVRRFGHRDGARSGADRPCRRGDARRHGDEHRRLYGHPAHCAGAGVTSFTPSGGIHGVQVRARGTGLTGATSVKFNGKPASFTAQNDTTILATVPTLATTGHIAVTTPGGTATSAANFTI